MRRVVVTQPYVPAYRVPLFDEVARQLAAQDWELTVVAPEPHGEQALRGDAAHAPWLQPMSVTRTQVGGKVIERRRLPADLRGADVLVTELDAKNTFAWSRRHHRARRVVLWGHAKSYVTRERWLNERAKAWISRRADAVMTYTAGGRDHALANWGCEPDRVAAIGNATDVAPMRTAYERALADGTGADLARTWGGGPHALYVGGLDSSKRLDFLLAAARRAHEVNPGFVLVVCGDGAERAAVESAHDEGYVAYQGYLAGADVGRVASGCAGLWMPGRVGLVATDAATLGLPVLTTHYEGHAPELEYLRDPWVQFLTDDPATYADEAMEVMTSVPMPGPMPGLPSIESVARNFVGVVTRDSGDE